MRKLFYRFAAIIMAITCFSCFAGCASTNTEQGDTNKSPDESEGPTHTHKYTSEIIAPTCQEQGYTLHTCSCGDEYKDNYTNATSHNGVGKCIYCHSIFNSIIAEKLPSSRSINHESGNSILQYSYTYDYNTDTEEIIVTAYAIFAKLSGNYNLNFTLKNDASWEWRIDMYMSLGLVESHEFLTGKIETNELYNVTPSTATIPFDSYSSGMTTSLASALDGITTIALHDIIGEIRIATEAVDKISLDNFGLTNYK